MSDFFDKKFEIIRYFCFGMDKFKGFIKEWVKGFVN